VVHNAIVMLGRAIHAIHLRWLEAGWPVLLHSAVRSKSSVAQWYHTGSAKNKREKPKRIRRFGLSVFYVRQIGRCNVLYLIGNHAVSLDGDMPGFGGREPDARRLVAVVYADMVGYSRLISLDDSETLARLRLLRRNVIDPAIREYEGRVLQTGGDSLLIVFNSVHGAMHCALKIQQQVPFLNDHYPPDRAIRFRIAVNIGDAIVDGTNLHGDVVNVVARLQAECPAGGICVTRAVVDSMRHCADFFVEELGTLSLRNIRHPVDAFVVRLRHQPQGENGHLRSAPGIAHQVKSTPKYSQSPVAG
jgi:class 3 adenylate cyclase